MVIEIARWILIVFGVFFIIVGGVMFFKPLTARATLRKAGSTNLIHFGEITVRMIPAVALILFSSHSMYPTVFNLFGWFMLLTSLVLYFVPKRLHHDFSNKSATILKPIYFQFISPISVAIGIMLIRAVI